MCPRAVDTPIQRGDMHELRRSRLPCWYAGLMDNYKPINDIDIFAWGVYTFDFINLDLFGLQLMRFILNFRFLPI